ncbi:MAG: LysM peptidoglycan-binding domain-containing protein [Chthoniobacterales bacterium]
MMRGRGKFALICFALSILPGFFCGCDRMMSSRQTQLVKDAESKAAQADFARAINLYEAALNDTPGCAEVHYRLALLYDDKLEDPLNALHHFKRYLTLAPNGAHAADVQKFIKRDEIALATSFSGDAVVTRAEAARLRNENLNLRKELEQRAAKTRAAESTMQDRAVSTAPRRGEQSEKSGTKKSKRHTYVVQSGDTLASISRRFYRSSARWKEILDANRKSIDDPQKLRAGQSLIIP